jgi:hypothetical protein
VRAADPRPALVEQDDFLDPTRARVTVPSLVRSSDECESRSKETFTAPAACTLLSLRRGGSEPCPPARERRHYVLLRRCSVVDLKCPDSYGLEQPLCVSVDVPGLPRRPGERGGRWAIVALRGQARGCCQGVALPIERGRSVTRLDASDAGGQWFGRRGASRSVTLNLVSPENSEATNGSTDRHVADSAAP